MSASGLGAPSAGCVAFVSPGFTLLGSMQHSSAPSSAAVRGGHALLQTLNALVLARRAAHGNQLTLVWGWGGLDLG